MPRTIHEKAVIGPGTEIGYYSVILEGVRIGRNCRVGHHVTIHPGTVIGNNVRIDDNTVIGKLPMRSAVSVMTKEQELPPAQIGDECIIGTSVVVYRGCVIGGSVLVADFASVREDVQIGNFTVIGRGVAVENKVRIGKRCKIETEAYITALSEIGDHCFVAPEATFTNDNFMGRSEERFKYHKGITIKTGGRVGANATILPGLTVEEDGLVAAGAVVTRDVPSKKVVVGIPAKVWGDVPEMQLLARQKST